MHNDCISFCLTDHHTPPPPPPPPKSVLTPMVHDSSVGNFIMNLLPAFSSMAFRGRTRHTTLILHSSAILQSMVINKNNHRRVEISGLWKDRSCSETKLATSSSVWRNVKQKKTHRAANKSHPMFKNLSTSKFDSSTNSSSQSRLFRQYFTNDTQTSVCRLFSLN